MSETILTDAGFARRVAAELDAHGYPNHHMLMVEARRRADLCDPTQDERVKALDLSAILKHAFLSGVVAARSIPADYPCDGPDLWAEYEPYEPGPYTRILAALRALEPSHNKGTKPNE